MKVVVALLIKIQIISLVSESNFGFNLNDIHLGAIRFKRASSSSCLQPPVTPDKTYTIKALNKDDISNAKPGEAVSPFTVILPRCNEGYAVNYQTDHQTDGPNESPSVCINNVWQPPLLKCKRICDNFSHFSNFNMSCYEYFGGPKIPCNGLLLERAIVTPRCRDKFHPNIKVTYDYATCREDGTWDKSFFKCIPDCGQVASSSVTLIADGFPERRGGAPWNVAIYSTQMNSNPPDFICGGTLINAELGISAAHCFYDEVFHKNLDPKFFRVIVGKATRDYKKEDYTTTKTYSLKKIFFPETTYKGAVTNYASDIVIFQLSDKVSLSPDVLPACLHWDDKDRFNPGENSKGKLSGFGATNNGSLADVLLSAYLPYVSYSNCLNKVREDFLGSISVDKFCAGSEKGPGARSGDSGGGLVFMDKATGLYHLRGVVSNNDLSESSIATFTDITQYIAWIIKVMENIERDSDCKCSLAGSLRQGTCNSKSDSCQCKAFVTGKDCAKCKDGFWNLRAENTDGCVACGCNSAGSLSSTCDKTTGACQCRANVTGRQCDECVDSTEVLGANGCEEGPKWLKFANGDKCSNAVVGGNRTPMNEVLYIARHQINENLLPGKLVPSQKLAFIPLFYGECTFSQYEVLCGGSGEWVAASNGVIPTGAVAGGLGFGNIGPETMYVCRAKADDGSVVPGKLHPSKKVCFIPNGGKEHPIGNYEVLVQHNRKACECNTIGTNHPICEGTAKSCKCKPNVIGKNCDRCAPDTYNFGPQGCKEGPKWVKYSKGEKCSNAVVGGNRTPMNEVLYIARHRINENLLPGKLVPSQKLAFIPLYYGEHPFPEYEVLCGGSTKWVAASRGVIPEGAFGGGTGYSDIGPETMYVCRAKADDGSIVPGKLHPSKKACFIPNGGKEHVLDHYEVLVV